MLRQSNRKCRNYERSFYSLMSRFVYMHLAIAGPEEELGQLGVAIGILGMPRSKFDTMLHFLSLPDSVAKSNMLVSFTVTTYKS